MNPKSIAIFGAGPIGLEAAFAASSAGFPFTIYEAFSLLCAATATVAVDDRL